MVSRSRSCEFVWYSIIATVIIIADRLSKWYAIRHWIIPKHITSFLSFELVYNRGVSWGLFHSTHNYIFMIVSGVIAGVTALVAFIAWKEYKQNRLIIGELMVVAGSISNLIDRAIYGAVVDFILVAYGAWSWPVFNIADMAIVCGISWMLFKQYRL